MDCTATGADFARVFSAPRHGKLGSLEHLDFGEVSIPDDRTMAAMANNCANLKYVDVGHCYEITDGVVREVLTVDEI